MQAEHKVPDILERIYQKERILTRSITNPNPRSFVATVVFPPQNKSRNPADHVSNSLIAEALTECMYAATAHAVRSGQLDMGYTFEEFVQNEANFFIRQMNIKFSKQLVPHELSTFLVDIKQVKPLSKFYSVEYLFRGDIRAQVTGLFPRKGI